MANEISIDASLEFVKGSSVSLSLKGLSVDVTGNNFIHNRQTVGTSEEAIAMGDAGAGGYCIFINRDATNFVEIRQGTGIADLVRIDAGEVALFRLAADATAPFAIADTGDVELEYIIVEA